MVQSFLQKLSTDQGLARQVEQELQKAGDRTARFVEIAATHGFHLQRAEVERALQTASRELGESELEAVAGGLNPQPEPPGRNRLEVSSGDPQGILIGLLLPAVQKVR